VPNLSILLACKTRRYVIVQKGTVKPGHTPEHRRVFKFSAILGKVWLLFRPCKLFNDAVNISGCTASHGSMIPQRWRIGKDLEGSGGPWSQSRHYPGICREGLSKTTKIHMIGGVSIGIQTEHLPNTSWKRFPLELTCSLPSSWEANSGSASQSQSQSVGQSVLVSSPIWGPRPDFYFCLTVAGLLMWGALSDERMGLSFTMYNIFIFYMLLHECILVSTRNSAPFMEPEDSLPCSQQPATGLCPETAEFIISHLFKNSF
jgi:hypothetical protein